MSSRPRPASGLAAKKTSVKRCLSPGSEVEERGPGGVMTGPGGAKRKSTDPALLLVQSEAGDLSELTSQYRLILEQARRDSEPSLASSSCSLVTAHSTSYTSWTRPVQGRRGDSDTCGPNSSILDIYTEQEQGQVEQQEEQEEPAQPTSLAEPSLSLRESSADTSKDVSDIESDWDEEIPGMDYTSEQKGRSNKNSSSNNPKRSIFLQHKKIKKFSL